MKLLLTLISVLCFAQILLAQNPDSLKKIIKTSKNDSLKLQALTDLNWIYSNSDFKLSKKYALEEIKLAKEINSQKWLAQGYNDLAISYYKMGQLDSARKENLKALDIRIALKDSMAMISSWSKLGNLESDLGNYKKALSYQLKALRVAERSNPGLEAVTLNNISIIFDKLKQNEKVIEYASKSAKKNLEVGNEYGAAQAYGNLAIAYNKKGNLKKSNEYLKLAYPIFKKVGDIASEALIYNSLGLNLRREKKHQEALVYYEKAYAIAKEMSDPPSQNLYAHNISCVYRDLGNYELAKKYSLESLENTEKINNAQLLLNYRQLATVYGYLKDGKKVEFYLDKYAALKDSVFTSDFNKNIAEMEVAYKTEKTQKELAEEKARVAENELKLESRKRWMLISFLVAFLILASAFWFYRVQKQRMEAKKREFELNKQLETAVLEKTFAEEKIRISRELHDNIGSHLTFLISSLDNLPYTKDADKRLQKVAELSNFGRLTMKDLRDTIWAMNHDGGTVESLITRISELRKVLPESISFEIEQDIRQDKILNGLQLLNMYRIVQEAIQNTLKYAEANEIVIKVRELTSSAGETRLHLSIQDNGKGFSHENIAFGNGLHNMKRRCEDIGGSFELSSHPSGTQITCEFNL